MRTKAIIILAIGFWLLVCSAIRSRGADDSAFRRQIQSTDFTRGLLTATNAAAARTLLGIATGQDSAISVDSIADLVAIDVSAFDSEVTPTYLALGYRTPGDGGGGLFFWDSASVATTNLGTVFQATGVTTGRWERVAWDGDIRAFGGKPDDEAFDNGAILTAASLYRNQTGGGVILMPAGIWYHSTAPILYPNTQWIGPGTTYTEATSDNTASSLYRAGSSAVWRRTDAANVVQCTISTNGGYFRQSVALYDGSTASQFYVNVRIHGLMFDGNGPAQTTGDCHTIVAEDAWNVDISDVVVVNHRGKAIRMRKVNALSIDKVHITDANYLGKEAVLLDTCGDFTVNNCFLFGGRGARIRSVGLGGHKGLIVGNLVGNSVSNSAVSITDVTSGLFTASAHNLWNGDIIQFRNTGSLPSSLLTNTTYFVRRESADTFRVHTNYALSKAGTTLSIGSIPGASTLSFREGYATSLSFEDGARRTSVIGNRFDQNEGSGVVLDEATGISLTANIIQENGFNTATAAGSVHLLNDSTGNVIMGNWGAGQEYGIWLDHTARYNVLQPNYWEPVIQGLYADAEISEQRNAFGDIGLFQGVNRLGSTNAAAALVLVGGRNAQEIQKWYRPDAGQTIGLRVVGSTNSSDGGFQFFDTDDQDHIVKVANTDSGNSVIEFSQASSNWPTVKNSRIRGSLPPTGFTNWPGAYMIFEAPVGIGSNNLGGSFLFQTGNIDTNPASATTVNVKTTKVHIKNDGRIKVGVLATEPTADLENGDIYYDSGAGKLRVRSGGAWIDLH